MIADVLSRDDNISDNTLIALLRLIYPSQMITNFHTSPVPPEIELWLHRMLPLSMKLAQDPKEKTASAIGVSLFGADFLQALNSEIITS